MSKELQTTHGIRKDYETRFKRLAEFLAIGEKALFSFAKEYKEMTPEERAETRKRIVRPLNWGFYLRLGSVRVHHSLVLLDDRSIAVLEHFDLAEQEKMAGQTFEVYDPVGKSHRLKTIQEMTAMEVSMVFDADNAVVRAVAEQEAWYKKSIAPKPRPQIDEGPLAVVSKDKHYVIVAGKYRLPRELVFKLAYELKD